MVGRPPAGPPVAAYLPAAGAALAGAFGCLVLADRRRRATGDARPAYAGLRSPPR